MKITLLTLEDCGQLARLHQSTFFQGWNEKDFQSFLKDPCIFGFKLEQESKFCGYILCREVADEAEIFAFGVALLFQRKGMGQLLLNAVVDRLKTNNISKLFLEVAEDNMSAQNFYKKNGFTLLGKRDSYYLRPNNTHVSALNFLKTIVN